MRPLVLLLGIGLADLVATATLHARGLIEERNPMTAPLLTQGEWGFVVVKAATLLIAGVLLAKQARHDRNAVRRACLLGSGAYALLLVGAFLAP